AHRPARPPRESPNRLDHRLAVRLLPVLAGRDTGTQGLRLPLGRDLRPCGPGCVRSIYLIDLSPGSSGSSAGVRSHHNPATAKSTSATFLVRMMDSITLIPRYGKNQISVVKMVMAAVSSARRRCSDAAIATHGSIQMRY